MFLRVALIELYRITYKTNACTHTHTLTLHQKQHIFPVSGIVPVGVYRVCTSIIATLSLALVGGRRLVPHANRTKETDTVPVLVFDARTPSNCRRWNLRGVVSAYWHWRWLSNKWVRSLIIFRVVLLASAPSLCADKISSAREHGKML